MENKFEQYAVVELFGHQVIAGMVSEQVIGGQGFVRVDVPAVNGSQAFTKFYGAGAIYAISPCDEATVFEAVSRIQPKPIQMFVYGRALPARDEDDFEDGE